MSNLGPNKPDNIQSWLKELRQSLSSAAQAAVEKVEYLQSVAQQARELADMDFSLLYDKQRELFAIGYNVSQHRLDASYYDLLASEARLASFVVIALGQFRQHLSHQRAFARIGSADPPGPG